jgi:hypothetical protein
VKAAKRLGGLEIDDQLDFRRLHDRQVSGLLALENPAGVDASEAVVIRKIASARVRCSRVDFPPTASSGETATFLLTAGTTPPRAYVRGS